MLPSAACELHIQLGREEVKYSHNHNYMHTLTFCHLEEEEGLLTEDQNADQCKNAMRD